MNISSSVVTPPINGHASQKPSPAPGLLSHDVLRARSVCPLQGCPGRPAVQPVGTLHGPPTPGNATGGRGEPLRVFTSFGLVYPLSYSEQKVTAWSSMVAFSPGKTIGGSKWITI